MADVKKIYASHGLDGLVAYLQDYLDALEAKAEKPAEATVPLPFVAPEGEKENG